MLGRITALRGDEPWPGYDELTAAEVQAVLSEGDDERARQVRSYERAHKNRAGVLKTAERELTTAYSGAGAHPPPRPPPLPDPASPEAQRPLGLTFFNQGAST